MRAEAAARPGLRTKVPVFIDLKVRAFSYVRKARSSSHEPSTRRNVGGDAGGEAGRR